MRMLLAAAMLLILPLCPAAAQDRPLLEPLRIGYARNDALAGRLRAAASLERALRRNGFLVVWQDFESGLDAVRALHAERVDLALNASLHDVIVAKRDNLKMVFIGELRSIAPTCCDLEQFYADHMFKRYTLASEYFADRREDVLLIVHQEMTKALQQPPVQPEARHKTLGPIPVATIDRDQPGTSLVLAPVTRSSMQQSAVVALLDEAATGIDLADVNYWLPD
jgi:hypothetical protein